MHHGSYEIVVSGVLEKHKSRTLVQREAASFEETMVWSSLEDAHLRSRQGLAIVTRLKAGQPKPLDTIAELLTIQFF